MASALRAWEAFAGHCPHHGGGQMAKEAAQHLPACPQTIHCGPGCARPSVLHLRARDMGHWMGG